MAQHLAQGGVLAAHQRDVAVAQLFQGDDLRGSRFLGPPLQLWNHPVGPDAVVLGDGGNHLQALRFGLQPAEFGVVYTAGDESGVHAGLGAAHDIVEAGIADGQGAFRRELREQGPAVLVDGGVWLADVMDLAAHGFVAVGHLAGAEGQAMAGEAHRVRVGADQRDALHARLVQLGLVEGHGLGVIDAGQQDEIGIGHAAHRLDVQAFQQGGIRAVAPEQAAPAQVGREGVDATGQAVARHFSRSDQLRVALAGNAQFFETLHI